MRIPQFERHWLIGSSGHLLVQNEGGKILTQLKKIVSHEGHNCCIA